MENIKLETRGRYIDVELLNKLFEYDELTGILYNKINRSSNSREGETVGTYMNNGYLKTSINDREYLIHRLIWFLNYGYFPEQVDHINGDRSDNRLSNLRESNDKLNQENLRSAKSNNKLGLLGVFKRLSRGKVKYVSKIMLNGKSKWIGSFDTPEEAHKAYVEKKRELHRFCTI